ncbi:hypothetical protein ILUMI_11830 [Ignelater luminosus]|uniref:Arrestin C-terminal-like domain-containing protein n=1 Tax=Ignelater luminosus TaxID=2038154 RepID=A0A8K0D1G6_IGNLU|nr:hypothetical protein ILUMI_11830 [Ignelater luminosus]
MPFLRHDAGVFTFGDAFHPVTSAARNLQLDSEGHIVVFERTEKLDEKLHRRTTVRMGIRVVQRAAAPPSPYLFNPTGTQNVSKQRSKNGHKIPLFSCKSAPLQTRLHVESPKPKNRTPDRIEELNKKDLNLKNEVDTTNEKNMLTNLKEQAGESLIEPDNMKNQQKSEEIECRVDDSTDDTRDKKEDITTTNRLTETWDENGSKEENKSVPEVISSNKTPTHVSFKDQLTNGIDNKEHGTSHTNGSVSDEDEKDAANKSAPEQTELSEEENKKNQMEKLEPPCGGKRPSLAAFLAQVPPPHATVEKPFLLSDGRVELEACLNKGIYSHGEEVQVSVQVRNFSNKTVKRIKVFIVQHVDVCMFSNGKFKNVVASVNGKEDCPVSSGSILTKTYSLIPTKSTTKNWIALEDSYTKTGTSLASTVTSTSDNPQDRNVFAIYVTYYVKVKLIVSVMGGKLSLKLPFTLMHTCSEFDPTWTRELESPRVEAQPKSTAEEVKQEKDGT